MRRRRCKTLRSESMNKKLFSELVESMTQMNEIVRGKRAPLRKFDETRRTSSKRSRRKTNLPF